MENKNIKIIDEHGIDRNGNIICSIDVDGSDYIVYSIERDNENDNIFVSKLINNIDGTSNLMNIEDSNEKEKIDNIVKELITYAINSENDTLTDNQVVLNNGNNIKIMSSIINREQSINVQKTYITTVKNAVTKVVEKFYVIKKDQIINNEIFTNSLPNVLPDVNKEEINPIISTPEIVLEPNNAVSLEKMSDDKVNSFSTVNEEVRVTPTLGEEHISEVKSENPSPVNEIKVVEAVEEAEPSPFISNSSSQLLFDASKESNLNSALDNSKTDTSVSVSDVEPIREFGNDNETNDNSLSQSIQASSVSVHENTNITSNESSGFANNKFLTALAITFFVAACVFLGYEAFKYFQLVK